MVRKSLGGSAYVCFVTLLLSVVSTAQGPVPPDLDAYVARVLKEFNVPGL
jgi:hypothetical protein